MTIKKAPRVKYVLHIRCLEEHNFLSYLSWGSEEKPACFRMEQGEAGDDRERTGKGSSALEGYRDGEVKLPPHLTCGSDFPQ